MWDTGGWLRRAEAAAAAAVTATVYIIVNSSSVRIVWQGKGTRVTHRGRGGVRTRDYGGDDDDNNNNTACYSSARCRTRAALGKVNARPAMIKVPLGRHAPFGALRLYNITDACSTWTTMIRFGEHRARTRCRDLHGSTGPWPLRMRSRVIHAHLTPPHIPATRRHRAGQHFRVFLRVQLTAEMRVTRKIMVYVKSHFMCASDTFYALTEEYEIPASTRCDNIDFGLIQK